MKGEKGIFRKSLTEEKKKVERKMATSVRKC